MQLRISHKGLILISVPLLFELIFAAVLVSMLRQAESEAATLDQSKAVVAYTSELNQTLLNAGYLLLIWKSSHSESFVRQYEGLVSKVPGIYNRLSELTKDNLRQRDHINRLKQISDKILTLTAKFRRPSDSAMLAFMNMSSYGTQLESAYQALTTETQALDREEEQLQSGSSDSEHRSRVMIYQVLALSVLFNILLSIGLAVFLGRSITSRLNVLMENTTRLASGNPLRDPVGGQDEIATLDRIFHKMATILDETAMRKQEFVSMITHDLRTPLTSMKTVLSGLIDDAEERNDESEQRRIGIVQRSVDRLINLVNDLLDMDRLEAGSLPLDIEKVNLKAIVARSVEAVRFFAEQHDVGIITEGNLDVELEADARRLEQIIINLLSNAIKFSPKNGTVTMTAESEDGSLKIEVKDLGRGIPRGSLATVFDRFLQVKQEDYSIKGGSGLGLAICKALVDLHHGNIGVDSEEGAGSKFYFRLPLKQPAAESPTQKTA